MAPHHWGNNRKNNRPNKSPTPTPTHNKNPAPPHPPRPPHPTPRLGLLVWDCWYGTVPPPPPPRAAAAAAAAGGRRRVEKGPSLNSHGPPHFQALDPRGHGPQGAGAHWAGTMGCKFAAQEASRYLIWSHMMPNHERPLARVLRLHPPGPALGIHARTGPGPPAHSSLGTEPRAPGLPPFLLGQIHARHGPAGQDHVPYMIAKMVL